MKKVIKLTESELMELVKKVMSEDNNQKEISGLPKCSDKKDNELVGGVVNKVQEPQSRAQAISKSFNNAIHIDVNLYISKGGKPFCRLR
jgi:hypothetical protein